MRDRGGWPVLRETHGTNAAYVAGCRCDKCRAATRKYHKALVLDHHRGIRRLVDATGTRRRIESLGALGWTGVQIGERLGVSGEHVRQLRSQDLVTREMARRMSAVFEELSMKLPPETTRTERHNASRQRNKARVAGWPPPLAWDDIDDPTEQPEIYADLNISDFQFYEIDEVKVERILAGDTFDDATVAEKREVVRRWIAAGQPVNELARRTGWKVERYGMKRDLEKAS